MKFLALASASLASWLIIKSRLEPGGNAKVTPLALLFNFVDHIGQASFNNSIALINNPVLWC